MKFVFKQLLPVILAVLSWQSVAEEGGLSVIELNGAVAFEHGKTLSKAAKTKVGRDLIALHTHYQANLSQSRGKGAGFSAFESSKTLARVAANSVVIDVAASGDSEQLAVDLRRLGAQEVTVFGRMVSARLPLSAIPTLNDLSSLQFARPAYAVTHAGVVTSQGDGAMLADIARTLFSVNGTGVKVGVLSDSFNCLKDTLRGAEAGFANDDLPLDVTVLAEQNPCTDATDEGRAMMEIIHDIAPGAAQSFHSAFNGQADFAQGIIDLANDGAKVIVDDTIYFAEPFYQDGNVAQAVDIVKGMGVAYFSAAGNSGRMAYESAFRPSGKFIDLGLGDGPQEAHDFDPGAGTDVCQKIAIPVGENLIMDFQWDQPFFSVSGAPGSASDMDIVMTDAACKKILGGSIELNIGGDPFEIFQVINQDTVTSVLQGVISPPPDPEPIPFPTVSPAAFGLMILHYAGPKPTLMKMINFGSTSVKFKEFDTKSATTVGHSNALGGLGVGAVGYQKTPEFGVKQARVEGFSSAGGSPILFDTAGNRLATPEVRQQPAIMAPDGADTSFFGESDSDKTGLPNFFGTSAAAPHAAGVAALLNDLVPTLTPDETYEWMKASAFDMNDPSTKGFDKGFDYGTGFGLIQAVADFAVTKVSAPTITKGAAPITNNVNVTIQNRSPFQETITVSDLGDGITTGLIRLNVSVIDDDSEACAAAQVSLDAANTLEDAKVLKPKQKLTVKYLVTYNCTGPANSNNDATPGDYSHNASVHHEVLGILDAHSADDICPRSVTPPFEVDPSPDGKIKDKGCGAKKADNTFGNPVVTNVVGK